MKKVTAQKGSSQSSTSLHFGQIAEVYTNGTARALLPDMDGMTTMPLPVGHQNTSDRVSYWMPEIGQPVAVLLDEKGESGVILCGIYTSSNPPPVADLDKLYIKFGNIEITASKSTGVIQIEATRIDITNPTESRINGKAIAVIGAMDNDNEVSGPDAIVSSGQL